ncbi:MAG: SDR family NAD(P)-dependent oxidoreductase [Sphingobium sp.]
MTEFDLGLAGMAALVTGAGGGIGRATALLLGNVGAAVAVIDRDGEAARKTVEDIVAQGGKAVALTADVTCEDDVLAAAADAEAALGIIRILVNNAGIGERRAMLDLPLEAWKTVLDVNLTAVFHVTQLIARRMVASGVSGAIVNVASVAGLNGVLNRSSYAAAKHGVVGLTRTLALELAPHNIRVNAVAPGIVATSLTSALLGSPAGAAASAAAHPLGRVAEASEVADAIVFLASQRASFVTGAVLAVDGGFLAGKVA